VETMTRARGVAWAAVALLACGLCYSVGFQSGWNHGADTANHHWDGVIQALHDSLVQPGNWPSAAAGSGGLDGRAS
jgi:hypothetical protein